MSLEINKEFQQCRMVGKYQPRNVLHEFEIFDAQFQALLERVKVN
jgi:hypothetical protein